MTYTVNGRALSAKDLVDIIRACGDAGVTELPLSEGVMKLAPKFQGYREEIVMNKSDKAESFTLSPPVTYDVDLALQDPLEWQRQGMTVERPGVDDEA